MRVALLMPLMLLCGPAAAADLAADAAVMGAQVLDTHCTTVAGNDSTASAEALATVSEAWGKVSEAFEESHAQYLLYWRGVLAQCLSQEEKAEADLGEFVVWVGSASEETQQTLASLRDDAARRLRQLQRRTDRATAANAPLLAAGLGSLGGAAALGGLAGWQAAATQETGRAYIAEGVKDFDQLRADGDRTQRAAIGLGVGAGLAGVVGAVLLPLSRILARPVAAGPRPTPPTVVLIPSRDGRGLGFAVGGEW